MPKRKRPAEDNYTLKKKRPVKPFNGHIWHPEQSCDTWDSQWNEYDYRHGDNIQQSDYKQEYDEVFWKDLPGWNFKDNVDFQFSARSNA